MSIEVWTLIGANVLCGRAVHLLATPPEYRHLAVTTGPQSRDLEADERTCMHSRNTGPPRHARQRRADRQLELRDHVAPVVDLDGDRRDELLIRSGWGTGLIRRDNSGALRLVDAQPNAGLFGSWQVAATDKIAGLDRFLPGDAPAQSPRGGILVQR